MKTKPFLIKIILAAIIFSVAKGVQAQKVASSDSIIKIIMEEGNVTGDMNDHGTTLILNGNYSAASAFYNAELKKDEGNKAAFFNRGLVHWITADTVNACRDWSALLALGDTAAFKLLDGKCHGAMSVDEDVIPKAKYHKMFAANKKVGDAKAPNSNARFFADEMPEFPGGNTSLLSYLSSNVKYPAAAKEKKVQGTVYVNFVVSSNGKVLYPYVVRGIGSGCDEEALRVIRTMPVWKPGKQKGKPILVSTNLPVVFHLK